MIAILRAWYRARGGRKRTHLRHVLRVALELEKRGQRFYHQLADASRTQTSRQLWERLCRDEQSHQRVIRQMLGRWRSLPLERSVQGWYEQRIQSQGIFSQLPGPAVSTADIARYALEQEERMANFYALFEKEFPAAWKRWEIQMLVMAERSHAAMLRRVFSEADRAPAGWREGSGADE